MSVKHVLSREGKNTELRRGVFESRVLRRIFGPERENETGYCRKLHDEELHKSNSWSNTVRMTEPKRITSGHATCMGGKIN
jgi:hypothetical protein